MRAKSSNLSGPSATAANNENQYQLANKLPAENYENSEAVCRRGGINAKQYSAIVYLLAIESYSRTNCVMCMV